MKSQIKKLISIFACVCLLLTAIVIPASAAGETASYVKVTEAPADWSGDYLIVYEGGKKAYNGALTDLKKANGIAVTIADSKIEATDAMKAAQFTIAAVDGGYSIKSASGYYIGRTSSNTDSNDLLFSTSTVYVNAISMSGSDVNIVSGNTYLRWNNSSSFFRYYKSGTYTNQAAIALYKLEETTPPAGGEGGGEEPSCEHTATSAVPNGDETHKVVCDACDETITAVVDCTDDDANGKCDVCEGDVAISDDGGDEGDDTPTYAIVDTPVAGTAYKFGMVQGNLN
ncbi:MAG: hypothetical protein IKL46_03225, partial [Clostridia bacterium]|nr:hypothetical protein [Clostridia bacterium]